MTNISYSYPYRTGCHKVPYPTEAEAKAAVHALLTRKYPSKKGLASYRCRYCAGNPWHIGHSKWGRRL